ncbi:MAG: filamentous hemagglutinin N-terminal domain-containing protein, partial [Rhodospirillaceae bacterium]
MTDIFFGTPSFPSLPARSRHRAVSLRGRLLASVGLLMVQDGISRQPQRGAGSRRLRRAGIVGACALSSLMTGAAYANPTGGSVVAGQASIQAVTPNTLDILQSSDRAIINWQSFSIGAGETVNFRQPSAASVTLNRVVGNDPSAIFGSLTANGTVMLVNPNGVIFGAGSRVDVGGLVATTVDISDANFMGGQYIFDKPSGIAGAAVINEGDITIGDSGLAALVAPHVRNSGVIQARLGRVALAGAERFTLDFHGDGLLSFDAGSAVQSAPRDADGNPVGALVVNSGAISADGGTVALTARAVKGVIDTVINTDGVIKATSVGSKDGKIVLSGGSSGSVAISGVVDASGLGAGETGGAIVATGETVSVGGGAVVTADGSTGGGSIAIGSATGTRDGSWSERASVAAGAVLSADATETGTGGTITVLSTERTAHEGTITARGGAAAGDGGFVEVSSDQDIILSGSIDLSAANGKTGLFLLDPESLRIVAAGGGSQNTAASGGTLASGAADQGTGSNVNTLSSSVLEAINSNANIVLEATGLISVETSLNLQTGTGNSFTLRSTGVGGQITFTNVAHEIRTNGG